MAFPCWCYVRLFWNDLCWTERIVNVSVSAFPAPNAVHVPCPTCPTCNQKSSLLATRDSVCVGLACRLSNHALVQDSVLPRTCSGLCATCFPNSVLPRTCFPCLGRCCYSEYVTILPEYVTILPIAACPRNWPAVARVNALVGAVVNENSSSA